MVGFVEKVVLQVHDFSAQEEGRFPYTRRSRCFRGLVHASVTVMYSCQHCNIGVGTLIIDIDKIVLVAGQHSFTSSSLNSPSLANYSSRGGERRREHFTRLLPETRPSRHTDLAEK